jgi:hypothetical protein
VLPGLSLQITKILPVHLLKVLPLEISFQVQKIFLNFNVENFNAFLPGTLVQGMVLFSPYFLYWLLFLGSSKNCIVSKCFFTFCVFQKFGNSLVYSLSFSGQSRFDFVFNLLNTKFCVFYCWLSCCLFFCTCLSFWFLFSVWDGFFFFRHNLISIEFACRFSKSCNRCYTSFLLNSPFKTDKHLFLVSSKAWFRAKAKLFF